MDSSFTLSRSSPEDKFNSVLKFSHVSSSSLVLSTSVMMYNTLRITLSSVLSAKDTASFLMAFVAALAFSVSMLSRSMKAGKTPALYSRDTFSLAMSQHSWSDMHSSQQPWARYRIALAPEIRPSLSHNST